MPVIRRLLRDLPCIVLPVFPGALITLETLAQYSVDDDVTKRSGSSRGPHTGYPVMYFP